MKPSGDNVGFRPSTQPTTHTKSGYEIALIEKQGASEQREQGEIGFQALNGIKKIKGF